jgi:hypothetical protein
MCSEEEAEEADLEEDEDEDMGFCLFDDGPAPLAPLAPAPAPLPKLAQSAAVISKSPMAISYAVEALTTIPSDGVSYKVLVAIVPLEAVVSHTVTPCKTPVAYLQVSKAILFQALN